MRPIEEFRSRLHGSKHRGNGFIAKCPAHNDTAASLSFREGEDGRVLAKCFAGCRFEDIAKAVGMEVRDLMAPRNESKETESYNYTDEQGEVLCTKVRLPDKSMYWVQPDGTKGISGVRRVPYNLSELMFAIQDGEEVYLHEGEKAADAFSKAGIPSTCHGFGAGKWPSELNPYFKGARLTIVADRDDAGELHASYVARELATVAQNLRVVQSHTRGDKHDGFDHLLAGYDALDLVRRIDLEPPPKGRWIPLSYVKPEPIVWLLHPYIPLGVVSTLWGDGGTGKSTISRNLVAAITAGRDCKWGDIRVEGPSAVVMLSAEDTAEQTIVPQLTHLGGNLDLVIIREQRDHFGKLMPFELNDAGMAELEEIVRERQIRLVVVDPVVSYLSASVDIKDAIQVRYWMDSLRRIAATYDCAVLLIHHTNKAVGIPLSDRGMGSKDFYNASRSVFVSCALDIPNTGALFHIKCNAARRANPIRYRTGEGGEITWEEHF